MISDKFENLVEEYVDNEVLMMALYIWSQISIGKTAGYGKQESIPYIKYNLLNWFPDRKDEISDAIDMLDLVISNDKIYDDKFDLYDLKDRLHNLVVDSEGFNILRNLCYNRLQIATLVDKAIYIFLTFYLKHSANAYTAYSKLFTDRPKIDFNEEFQITNKEIFDEPELIEYHYKAKSFIIFLKLLTGKELYFHEIL